MSFAVEHLRCRAISVRGFGGRRGTPAISLDTVAMKPEERKEINVNVQSFPQRAHDASNRVIALFAKARHPQSPGGIEIVPSEEREIEDAAQDAHALTAVTVHGFRVMQGAFRCEPERLDELVRERNRVAVLAPEIGAA